MQVDKPKLSPTEQALLDRVFCPVCRATRIKTSAWFARCPNGHGKLVKAFSTVTAAKALRLILPVAKYYGRSQRRIQFMIDGHEGIYCYRGHDSMRSVTLSTQVDSDQVLAKHDTDAGWLVRRYTRIVN